MQSTRNAVIVQVPTALIAAFVGALCACADSPASPNAVKTAFRPLAAVLPATRTEFEGFINFCGGTDPTKINVTPGDILHFKGGTNQNVWVTGNPLIDGVEQNVVDANINLKSGSGSAHLAVSLKPDAVEGTWEIRQTVTISGGSPAGSRGVGHGTGDLQGMSIQFTTEPAVPIANVCNPELPGAPLHGVVISPATTS